MRTARWPRCRSGLSSLSFPRFSLRVLLEELRHRRVVKLTRWVVGNIVSELPLNDMRERLLAVPGTRLGLLVDLAQAKGSRWRWPACRRASRTASCLIFSHAS